MATYWEIPIYRDAIRRGGSKLSSPLESWSNLKPSGKQGKEEAPGLTYSLFYLQGVVE